MGAGETSRQKPASRAQAANGGADEGRYPTKEFKDFVARPSSATSLLKLDNIDFIPKCFVDVGANQGDWTREYLRYYPDASFFMVDANQENTKHWNEDIALNLARRKSINLQRRKKPINYNPINLLAQPNVHLCENRPSPHSSGLGISTRHPAAAPRVNET